MRGDCSIVLSGLQLVLQGLTQKKEIQLVRGTMRLPPFQEMGLPPFLARFQVFRYCDAVAKLGELADGVMLFESMVA